MRMRAGGIFVAALVVCAASMAIAQSAPNFAGKWTLVPDPAAMGGMGGLGQEATIAQDAATMTINRVTQMGEFKTIYKLDGSESKNTLSMGGNAVDTVSLAKWSGSTLLVDTSLTFDGNAIKVSMKMSLDPSGALVVETTRPDFQGGGGPVTTKSSYKKQ